MKKFILLVMVISAVTITAQNLNGRFTSSVYMFERQMNETESQTYLRAFETLQLNVNKDNFSLRTRLNFEANLNESVEGDPRLRFYNLYLEGRDIFNMATVRLGRISLFNTVGAGAIDGGSISIKHSGFKVTGFVGGNVPAYQKLEFTDDFSNDRIFGAEIEYLGLKDLKFGLEYVDKNFKPIEYMATRLDENQDPVQVLIKNASRSYKLATATASYFNDKMINVNTKAEFDVNYKELSRFEFSTRYSQIENLGISLYYNYREPKISYNSIFSVFNFGNSQEIEGGVDYKFTKTFKAFAKYANVEYEDDNSGRLTAGVNTEYGVLSYRKTFGYAGELDAVSAYTSRSFYDGMFTPSVGLSYTTYKLSEDEEENNLVTILGGLNYKPFKTFSVSLQGQYLNNKIYKDDYRLFLKLNHWFNSNLGVL